MIDRVLSKKKLKQRPLNATEVLILEALRRDRRPLSAYDLMDKLRGNGVKAPNTVYRALNRLMADGSVHRLETLNAYVACTHGDVHQDCSPMFAICSVCGGVEEFAVSAVASSVKNWTESAQFALGSMTLELRGTCEKCQIASGSERARG